MKTDERFSTITARFKNVSEYFRIRAEALKQKTTAEWVEIFDACDVPAMPYHTLDSLMEDPHLADVRLFETIHHPTEGDIVNIRLPNKLSGGVRQDFSPAPKLGQHSVEILGELGYAEAEIASLIDGQVTHDGRIREQD
jgi:crotonobetainyl-CoA:carnitine CoA-transferase CaiB-like acyl-CoA transferase